MPEEYYESTHFKLPALTGKNPIHDIGTGFKKLAEKADEVLFSGEAARLRVVEHGTSFAAAAGELVKCTAPITITTPSTLNAACGVLANGHEVKVKPASGNILGASAAGKMELTLSGYQGVLLEADGTNTYVIAATPLGLEPPPKYSTLTGRAAGVEYEPSVTQTAEVLVTIAQGLTPFRLAFFVGGVEVAKAAAGAAESVKTVLSVSFTCNAGEKWMFTAAEGTPTVDSTYRFG
jgi:hypothetical protein